MRRFHFFIASVLLALLLSVARGQESTDPAQDPYSSYFPSPSKCQWIASLATIAPVGGGAAWALAKSDIGGPLLVMAGGIILGPAIGYFAGHESGNGLLKASKRGGILAGTGTVVFFVALAGGLMHFDAPLSGQRKADITTTIAVIGGVGGTIALTMAVIDIISLGKLIRKHNESGLSSLAITPTAGNRGMGLAVRIDF